MALNQFNLKLGKYAPYLLSIIILGVLLLIWSGMTGIPKFDPSGLSEDDLMMQEMNGDIIRDESGEYINNPDKLSAIPGPGRVYDKAVTELSAPFEKMGTNDHGIGWLVVYTLKRFLVGFLLATVVAVFLGMLIGMSKTLLMALNPFIQVLKPVSPLAWMPLLLYSVKDPYITSVLVVFMASLWPTMANTAFGVSNIKKDYIRVSEMVEMSWFRRFYSVVLPASAPAIFAGLRISFGSALVAVVPAEMLLGELGVGYLSWIEWNNLDIAGVIFAIIVVGVVGFLLDYGLSKLAQRFTYVEA
ncbi:MAG TPA: nitrate ABC transporter, permease protein [Opitutae bacterium]|nr:nitrate ABC transporter, permease protein [Opitutae bacterium]